MRATCVYNAYVWVCALQCARVHVGHVRVVRVYVRACAFHACVSARECACVCARVRVRACVHACVCVHVCVGVGVGCARRTYVRVRVRGRARACVCLRVYSVCVRAYVCVYRTRDRLNCYYARHFRFRKREQR